MAAIMAKRWRLSTGNPWLDPFDKCRAFVAFNREGFEFFLNCARVLVRERDPSRAVVIASGAQFLAFRDDVWGFATRSIPAFARAF
jgi:hypothetical protein